jgi:tetratricopeptide (TPR) repeat protein
VRLTAALGWWWERRGRLPVPLLNELAVRVEPGGDQWCAVQLWLGRAAVILSDLAAGLGYFTALRDAAAGRGPSRLLADALLGRSVTLLNLGRLAEGADDARRALALSRELSFPVGEAMALGRLAIAALFAGEYDKTVQLLQQARQIPADLPGGIAREASKILTCALIESGDLVAAETAGVAALAQCREAGDLANLAEMLSAMADLELRAGRVDAATAYLREDLQLDLQAGLWFDLFNGLDICGQLCMATGRYAEAITVWAPLTSRAQQEAGADTFAFEHDRDAGLAKARQVLGAGGTRARRGDEPGHHRGVRAPARRPRSRTAGGGARQRQAQPPGAGAGHPGRPGPHRRADRRPAVHQRAHRAHPPEQDPGQDRLPPPRRPDPPGPADRAHLTEPGRARAAGRV